MPARGIMQTGDYQEAKSYQIACDCHSSDHAVHMWVEIDGDTECQDVQVGFFAKMYTPFWKQGFSRIRAAWNILVHGYQEQEHYLILNKQSAYNMIGAMEHALKELDRK